MALTVKDCLNIGVLREAKVISGTKGLNKFVSGVTVQDIDFDKWDSKNTIYGGELVLSSLKFAAKNNKKQIDLIKSLNNLKVSALIIFYLGITLEEISQDLINISDTLNFPVILMPENRNDFAYIDVINEITYKIMEDKRKNIKVLEEIIEKNSNTIFGNNDLTSILNIIGEKFNHEFIIINTFFEVIGFHIKNSMFSLEKFINEIKLDYLNDNIKSYISYKRNYKGLKLNNNIKMLPIKSTKGISGYLILLDNTTEIDSNIDEMLGVIKYFLRIFPHERSKLQYETEHINLLIENKKLSNFKNYLLLKDEIEFIIYIKSSKKVFEENTYIKLYNFIRNFLITKNLKCNIGSYKNNVVIILKHIKKSEEFKNISDILNKMSEELSMKIDEEFSIGYFSFYDNKDVKTELDLFDNNLKSCKILFKNKKIYDINDVLVVEILNNCPKSIAKRYLEDLRKIKKLYPDLLETIEKFLIDYNANIYEAAKAIHIHPNTLRYRVKSFENKTDKSIDNTTDLFYILFLCYLNRLNKKL